MDIQFTELEDKDFPIVKDIYDYYILNSTATFHTEKISIEELKRTIFVGHARYKSHLISYGGEICGYCYLMHFKPRQAYDKTTEITLYLKPDFFGKGIGSKVMQHLEDTARQVGINVLIGVITSSNTASIGLFEKCGYEKCAHYKQVGEKFGQLLDVVAYQKILPA